MHMKKSKSITYYPTVSFIDLLMSLNKNPINSLDKMEMLFPMGRDAIYWALKSLKYPEATPVWIPDFHCGVEVQAALHAGYIPKFYKIERDLTVNCKDLFQKIKTIPGPVILIHYFGFHQNEFNKISDFCYQNRLPLIEDCSHSLFSTMNGKTLGSTSPLSTFSLYKTIGSIDGGALKVNHNRFHEIMGRPFELPDHLKTSISITKNQIKSTFKYFIPESFIENYRKIRYGKIHIEIEDTVFDMLNEMNDWNYNSRISILSKKMGMNCNRDYITNKRRENYSILNEILNDKCGIIKVFSTLPKGVCPLIFPIFVNHRKFFKQKLIEKRIEPFVFGKFCHPIMDKRLVKNAEFLRKNIICLPIHHSLEPIDLIRIGETIKPMIKQHLFNHIK